MRAQQRGSWARRRVFALALVAAVVGGEGCNCFPIVPTDDAGDHAWVRQTVPTLLGRKVKGCEEVEMLADLVAVTDRDTVARALMAQDEFTAHWSEVFVDNMRVDREGFRSQGLCYGPPKRAGVDPGIASYILANAPTAGAAPGGAYNMSDAVASAVAHDNLAPLYRAHLFALQSRPPVFVPEEQRRNGLGLDFAEVYLNRQIGCLGCHNSDESRSGPDTGWNRTWPIFGSFEAALYGAAVGTDPAYAHGPFNTAVNAGATQPWGMSDCGTFDTSISGSGAGAYFTGPLGDTASIFDLVSRHTSGYAGLDADGLDRSVSSAAQMQCDFCASSCSGTTPADPMSVVNASFVESTVTNTSIASGCGNCHGSPMYFVGFAMGETWHTGSIGVASPAYPGQTRVIPGDGAGSLLIKKLRGAAGVGERMPYGGPYLADADVDLIEEWIDNLGTDTACAGCDLANCLPRQVPGDEAFAYLNAAQIVEVVWAEVMGHPVTIANYFPRNLKQRNVLWHLTENVFIPADWSLRDLLAFIVTADTYNRHAPHASTGTTPYELPLMFDPWVEADPRTCPVNEPECVPPEPAGTYDPTAHPESHNNAMTEGISRYRAQHLLQSTHASLDWPAPPRFPQASGYPDADLQKAIGQYISYQQPGFRGVDFSGLLAWESVHGACANPTASDDWIDDLTAEAKSFAAAPSDGLGPLLLRDVLIAERDWLLGDGTLNTTGPTATPGMSSLNEPDALGGVVAPLSLTADVAAISAADLEGALRKVCGSMIESPHYLLAGVVSEATCVDTRIRVCNDPACTYQEMCEAIKDDVDVGPLHTVVCGADSVSVEPLFVLPPDWWDVLLLCPEGWCGFLPVEIEPCLRNPEECVLRPPSCDPRCFGPECCGGTPRFDREGIYVAFADGAEVQEAEGVRVLRPGKGFEALEPGTRVQYGDLIEVRPTSTLRIVAVQRVLDETVEVELASTPLVSAKAPPRYLLISGPRALEPLARPPAEPLLRAENIEWIQRHGWLRFGEAGDASAELGPGGYGEEERRYEAELEAYLAAQERPPRD